EGKLAQAFVGDLEVAVVVRLGELGALFLVWTLLGGQPPDADAHDEQGHGQDADFFHFRHDTILMYIRPLIAKYAFCLRLRRTTGDFGLLYTKKQGGSAAAFRRVTCRGA